MLAGAGTIGYPTPAEELERIREALDEDFAQLPLYDQLEHLVALPPDEAAKVLERASESLRDLLLRRLPPDSRSFVERRWNERSRGTTRLSA